MFDTMATSLNQDHIILEVLKNSCFDLLAVIKILLCIVATNLIAK